MTTRTYRQGQELPSYGIEWSDEDGNLIDFSSGYTFTFSLFDPSSLVHVYQQTSGITGASTSPNILVAFPSGALDTVPAGFYQVLCRARQTSSTKDRDWPPGGTSPAYLSIVAAVT